jgi:cytochrome c-type biogenesis protein CcmH/NrfF
MLDQGFLKKIYNNLIADYGKGVLATPPKEGFDWIVWLALPAGILVGGVVVYKISRKEWMRMRNLITNTKNFCRRKKT